MSDTARDIEQDVLGAALLAGAQVVDALASDCGLRVEHFEFGSHRELYGAMLRLRDEDRAVDPAVLAATMNGKADKALISRCMSGVIAANFRDHAAEVIRFAKLRQLRAAGQLLLRAGDGDELAREQAEAILNAPEAEKAADWRDPKRLGVEFLHRLDHPEPAIPLPFPKLTELMNGGMRPGDVTLIGGATNIGKSLFIDGILDHATSRGYRCLLFDNEMMPADRTARAVSRMTGLSFGKLTRGNLNLEERQRAEKAAGTLPFGIVDCTDWSLDEVCRVIRRGEFDLYGLDILHNFPFRKTEEWEDAALSLKRAAHIARKHLLVAVHTRKRGTGESPGVPNLDDIAQAAGIHKRPANVIFVHREMSASGKQEDKSWLYVKKNRHGPLGKAEAHFQGHRARFVEAAEAA